MTKEEILKMQSGREMDALVAEKVMKFYVEWHWCKQDPECGDWYPVEYKSKEQIEKERKNNWYKPEKHPCLRFEDPQTHEFRAWEVVDFYSTSISAAWEVWEKIKEDKKLWGNFLRALFDVTDNAVLYRLNPEIICRAALLAVMEDK